MKKRLLSLFLVLAMLCAMSIGASAASASGKTEGYGSGYNSLSTSALLQMSATGASASTSSTKPSVCTFQTNVYFYYYSAPGVTSYVYNSGTSTTSIYADDVMNGVSARWADSYHYVWGGMYGNWECSLRDYGPAY